MDFMVLINMLPADGSISTSHDPLPSNCHNEKLWYIVLLLYKPGVLYITLKSLHFHITCSGCPRVLRTDAGTENCILAMIQPMLRHKHIDCFAQEKSHMYGRSTSNQVATVFSIQSTYPGPSLHHPCRSLQKREGTRTQWFSQETQMQGCQAILGMWWMLLISCVSFRNTTVTLSIRKSVTLS